MDLFLGVPVCSSSAILVCVENSKNDPMYRLAVLRTSLILNHQYRREAGGNKPT